MGAFIAMACDSRVAMRGDFKMSLPETATGMKLIHSRTKQVQSGFSSILYLSCFVSLPCRVTVNK
jgi:hypothetical protein